MYLNKLIMKKTIILITLLFLSNVSWSQVTYGVRAGMSLSSYVIKPYFLFKPGVHVGGIVDVSISSKFSLVSGLYFADKGSRNEGEFIDDLSNEQYSFDATINDYQIELPLLLTYKISLNNNLSLKPQIGMFASYTLYSEINDTRVYVKNSIKGTPIHSSQYYNALDYNIYTFGMNIGLSVLYKNFSFTYSWDLGVMSDYMFARSYWDGHYPGANSCMFFSLGYNF